MVKSLLILFVFASSISCAVAFPGGPVDCMETEPRDGSIFAPFTPFTVSQAPYWPSAGYYYSQIRRITTSDPYGPLTSLIFEDHAYTTNTLMINAPVHATFKNSYETVIILPWDGGVLCDESPSFEVSGIDWPYEYGQEIEDGEIYQIDTERLYTTGLECIYLDGTPSLTFAHAIENVGTVPVTIHDVFPAFVTDRINFHIINFPGKFTLNPGDIYFLQMEVVVEDRDEFLRNHPIRMTIVIALDHPDKPYEQIIGYFPPQWFESPADLPPDWDLPDPAPDPPFYRVPAIVDGWMVK